ncbi:hypothetical protein P7K49_022412, partial [Saguinus oedipus]
MEEGCPGLCNGNGRCTLDLNGWHCVCQLGWRGAGCDTSMETACGDSKDNDGEPALLALELTSVNMGHGHTVAQIPQLWGKREVFVIGNGADPDPRGIEPPPAILRDAPAEDGKGQSENSQ